MKIIIYILDSFSPNILKGNKSFFFQEKEKNRTFIDKLINKSFYFNNVYGYGETYSTTYSAIVGKDIYDNYCDAWKLNTSFKLKSNLGSMAKINGFETIYYRNSGPKSKVDSYFGRYLESINHNFKYKHLKNKKINDNLYKFIKKNNLLKKLNSNKKFLILLHDYSLHDSQGAYKGSTKGILNSAKNSADEVKKNLSSLNYNENKDVLIFFSDHGLTPYPYVKLFNNNFIKKKDYEKYYNKIFVDDKIKMLFFIKIPNLKKKIISKKFLKPKDINIIIRSFFKKDKTLEKIKLLKNIGKQSILTSLRSTRASIYENYFFKNMFHNHLIYIDNKKKVVFSNKHSIKYLRSKYQLDNFKQTYSVPKKLYKFQKKYFL